MRFEGEYIIMENKGWYIEGWYTENLKKVDINAAKAVVRERLFFQNDKNYPHLMHINVIDSTREAREFMKKEGIEGITAGAFVIESIFTKSIINFFLSVSKPQVPTKMFTDRDSAYKWLHQFKPQ